MESFQQSGLNISPQTVQKGAVHGHGRHRIVPRIDLRCQDVSATSGTLERAMRNEIEPLRSSFRSTAEAGEYDSAGGVETRD